MSTEGTTGASYEILIEHQAYPWGRDKITTAEIRTLGRLPENASVVAVNLADGEESVLDEDDVHELPPLEPGKPSVKRVNFKRGA